MLNADWLSPAGLTFKIPERSRADVKVVELISGRCQALIGWLRSIDLHQRVQSWSPESPCEKSMSSQRLVFQAHLWKENVVFVWRVVRKPWCVWAVCDCFSHTHTCLLPSVLINCTKFNHCIIYFCSEKSLSVWRFRFRVIRTGFWWSSDVLCVCVLQVQCSWWAFRESL